MSKTSKIVRGIIAVIVLALTALVLYVLFDGMNSILNVENGGWAVIGLVAYFIYGIPFVLAVFIYQLVLIIKKKFWLVDFIPSVLLIVSWASLYLAPAIMSAIG